MARLVVPKLIEPLPVVFPVAGFNSVFTFPQPKEDGGGDDRLNNHDDRPEMSEVSEKRSACPNAGLHSPPPNSLRDSEIHFCYFCQSS